MLQLSLPSGHTPLRPPVITLSAAQSRSAGIRSGADATSQQFEASYHDVRSLRADFNQTYQAADARSRPGGSFARGGLMRWDYQRPMEKLFISDGKQVSLYIPEEHQLRAHP